MPSVFVWPSSRNARFDYIRCRLQHYTLNAPNFGNAFNMRRDPSEVWNEVKAQALEIARSEQTPTRDAAQSADAVRQIVTAIFGSPDAVPQEAVEFYARELCAMVARLRRNDCRDAQLH